MNIEKLIKHANSIPDLGYGGKTVKDDLMYYAKNVKADRSIIDIAPCFGSTTAFLSCGVLQNENNPVIHSFDRWELQNDEYKHKAKKYCNYTINSDEDFIFLFNTNVLPFENTIIRYKMNILDVLWFEKNKIGLFILDIGANKEFTDKIFKTFSPAFIENETIIFMMDYYFYESHSNQEFLYQKNFMSENKNVFEFIKKVNGSKCAIYKFIGGVINYEVSE